MRTIPVLLLIFTISLTASSQKNPPQKYKATMKALLLGTVEGYVYVNLYGENPDRIKFDITSVKENSGGFAQPNSSVEVLTPGIGEIEIENAKYKFWQINDGERKLRNYCVRLADTTGKTFYALSNDTSIYTFMDVQKNRDETLQNCPVKKVYGLDSLGIFQSGFQWNAETAVIVLHRKIIAGGSSYISNPYFTATQVWKGILFRSCPPIVKNINDQVDGWVLKQEMTTEQKIEVWKKYINQWQECGKASGN